MRGRIATCSERLPRCEVASVSPQSSESALAGRRGCVPRRQETGGCRRQNRQYCGYFMSALTIDSTFEKFYLRQTPSSSPFEQLVEECFEFAHRGATMEQDIGLQVASSAPCVRFEEPTTVDPGPDRNEKSQAFG